MRRTAWLLLLMMNPTQSDQLRLLSWLLVFGTSRQLEFCLLDCPAIAGQPVRLAGREDWKVR